VLHHTEQQTNREAVIHRVLLPGTYVANLKASELAEITAVFGNAYCVPFTFTAQFSPVVGVPVLTMVCLEREQHQWRVQ
jgi:hypothetical protein